MIGIIVQADSKSKAFDDLSGKYVLQRVLAGVMQSKMAHKIILTMPEYDRKEIARRLQAGELSDYASHRGFSVFCGDQDNVLNRLYDACGINAIDTVIRINADYPFVQGNTIDDMLVRHFQGGANRYKRDTGIEIFPWWALANAYKKVAYDGDWNQVSLYFWAQCGKGRWFNDESPDLSIGNWDLAEKVAIEYDKHGDLDKALDEAL